MKIKDIAKLANVSISAVSLALNNKPGISQEKRAKILKIVEEEGYVQKSLMPINQPIQTNKKVVHFVACTNPGIVIEQYESLPFFTELIKHIRDILFPKGYSLMFSSINLDNLQDEIKIISSENGCNGILLLGTDLKKEQIEFIASHQPNIVVLDTCFETLNVDFINMNSVLGAYQATNHLIELGHKRIGYIQSNVRIQNFDLRKKGFLQALEESNLSALDKDYLSMAPTVLTSQEEFKEEIMKRRNDLPTAVICESDYLAISFIKSLTEVGIKVPDEISVVGFDDIQEGQILTPELTSVHVFKEKMASLAVDRIIELMEGGTDKKMKLIVDTKIAERKSCRQYVSTKDLTQKN
ncbi:LacI family DNA-binding transcriptional regulator [Halalkalibacter alkaliphilus]|uniref:LacI family DNA-binding transcriptional regulator n=1 Tax=Halalkalibacter alkaliphilus TaxID=2917993 RepID=A0A9X2IB25_9BACI|nr:LacI family DNA-binding transcriptional regulator [Halalkalibacter alkaliphilus]MCL7749920.1 LacI family DNA-binding transcriptional regulator [Halalkalibacter alkaliphilus]